MTSDPLERLRELLRDVPDLDSSEGRLCVSEAVECLSAANRHTSVTRTLRPNAGYPKVVAFA